MVPGTRVRFLAPWFCELIGTTGTVLRSGQWDQYYVIQTDQPYEYEGQMLTEILEADDNLEIVER